MNADQLDTLKFLFEVMQTAIVPAIWLLWKIDKRLSRVEWQLGIDKPKKPHGE